MMTDKKRQTGGEVEPELAAEAAVFDRKQRRDCTLSAVGCGNRRRIKRHRAIGAVRQRLLDMGLIPNTEVEVIRVAPLGDPIEVKVGDSRVTLRKTEADQIEIIIG